MVEGGCGGGCEGVFPSSRPVWLFHSECFIPSVCSAAALWPDCSGIFWRNPGGEQHRQRSVNAAQPRTPDREPGRRSLTPGFPPETVDYFKDVFKNEPALMAFSFGLFSFSQFWANL